jgi:hypothetical protein
MAGRARQREPRDWRTRRGAPNHKPRQYIRGRGRMAWRCRLGGAQILSGGLAGSAVRDHVEGDLLPFVERAQARAFDRADVHEDILAAGFRLNETEALLIVKPLHGSLVHGSPSCRYVWR